MSISKKLKIVRSRSRSSSSNRIFLYAIIPFGLLVSGVYIFRNKKEVKATVNKLVDRTTPEIVNSIEKAKNDLLNQNISSKATFSHSSITFIHPIINFIFNIVESHSKLWFWSRLIGVVSFLLYSSSKGYRSKRAKPENVGSKLLILEDTLSENSKSIMVTLLVIADLFGLTRFIIERSEFARLTVVRDFFSIFLLAVDKLLSFFQLFFSKLFFSSFLDFIKYFVVIVVVAFIFWLVRRRIIRFTKGFFDFLLDLLEVEGFCYKFNLPLWIVKFITTVFGREQLLLQKQFLKKKSEDVENEKKLNEEQEKLRLVEEQKKEEAKKAAAILLNKNNGDGNNNDGGNEAE